jgi:hypothetical protein
VPVSWESRSSGGTKAKRISEWNHLPLVDGEVLSGASSKVLEDGKLQTAACYWMYFISTEESIKTPTSAYSTAPRLYHHQQTLTALKPRTIHSTLFATRNCLENAPLRVSDIHSV